MNPLTVIAVNENDEVVNYYGKMEVHKKGILHRAISVFIFNSNGDWLLQQRARNKYHSGLLWSNTSCTHPMKGESNIEAAKRRLHEEMGLLAPLKRIFSFQYWAKLNDDLIEHELDHIFVGVTDELPNINKEEVASYRYISPQDLAVDIKNSPEEYTEWFKLLFARVLNEIN